ncbi:acyltransferase domain-containing protein, partial [Streptomyces actuosus]
GDAEGVEEIVGHFRGEGRKVTALRVSHAFHSPLMEPMLADFRKVVEALSYERPRLPIVSTVTGQEITGDELTSPDYWMQHVRSTVRFADAVRALDGLGVCRFLELGPEGTLTALAQAVLEDTSRADGDVPLLVSTLRKDRSETGSLLSALAGVFVTGGQVDWTAVIGDGVAGTVELPTYAFQRRRFWPAPALPEVVAGAGGEVDARFWEAVEREDLDSLAGELDLEADTVGAVLPALASWRRQRREQAELDGDLYRVQWQAISGLPRGGTLSGRWLVVVPDALAEDGWAGSVRDALTAAGADVVWWTCEPGPDMNRAHLAGRLEGLGSVTGVVSLLSFAGNAPASEVPYDGVPLAVSASLVLVQALGDAGVGGPLWVVTRGAVSVGGSDGPVDAVQAA